MVAVAAYDRMRRRLSIFTPFFADVSELFRSFDKSSLAKLAFFLGWFGYLIRATTSFFCALTPVPRVVEEGPRFHLLAPLQGGGTRATK
jgi:hypothetical protein